MLNITKNQTQVQQRKWYSEIKQSKNRRNIPKQISQEDDLGINIELTAAKDIHSIYTQASKYKLRDMSFIEGLKTFSPHRIVKEEGSLDVIENF